MYPRMYEVEETPNGASQKVSFTLRKKNSMYKGSWSNSYLLWINIFHSEHQINRRVSSDYPELYCKYGPFERPEDHSI